MLRAPSLRLLPSLGFALAAAAAPAAAQAAPCADLPQPIIYGLGGSATKPLLGKIAGGLTAAGTLSVVYQAPGACVGVNGLLASTPITGTASYWDAAGKEQSCTLPDAGQVVDFANMGNTAGSCPGVGALPAEVGDFLGPVNAYTFIVPLASSQLAISREAAYFAFGFGQLGRAAPWTDDTQIFRRDANSAAQLFVSIATGVPAEKFKGVDTKTNQGTITAVASASNPEAAIGLVSGEVADANRASVRVLAYQHTGQRCGFLPDSSATAFDKKNVRDGTYHIWAPIHFFARINPATKKIVNPSVASFVGLFTGEVTAPPNLNVLEAEIKSGNVPKCAMNVWRESDLGGLTKYAAP
ncbi:MAG: hypothetical protein HOO96_00980, partial [Polyangiaceae bacterium]|nr:hypothetical protein [Polyangiaceae bacterium]